MEPPQRAMLTHSSASTFHQKVATMAWGTLLTNYIYRSGNGAIYV